MSGSIHALFPRPNSGGSDKKDGSSHTTGGNPPSGDDMERRVQALEDAIPDMRDRLVRIETNMTHMASKADMSTLEATLIKWFVGTAFAMVGLATAIGFGLARLIN